MSTLTEIEAAVDSLPVAQQKKLFTVLKKRFASAPRAKNTGGKLKSASRPGIKGLGPKLSTATKEEIRELILNRHVRNR
jgi:hypothetical protein